VTEPQLVEVRLVGFSLPAFQHSSEHHDELFREFRLMLTQEGPSELRVPERLLRLVEELDAKFAGFTAGPQAELDAALDRGDTTIDLTFFVPPEVAPAATQFAELLAEADDFCRQGDLLTLAPPPEAIRFRDWYLAEFVAQIEGRPPTPYPPAPT
jgi:hypothetical protein